MARETKDIFELSYEDSSSILPILNKPKNINKGVIVL